MELTRARHRRSLLTAPFRAVGRLLERLYTDAHHDELVRHGLHLRRKLWLIGAAWFALGLVAMLALSFETDGFVAWVALFAFGWVLGAQSFGRIRRSHAYWCGWVNGRNELFRSLGEASKRDMTMLGWLETEQDRTMVVAGYNIDRPLPDDESQE